MTSGRDRAARPPPAPNHFHRPPPRGAPHPCHQPRPHPPRAAGFPPLSPSRHRRGTAAMLTVRDGGITTLLPAVPPHSCSRGRLPLAGAARAGAQGEGGGEGGALARRQWEMLGVGGPPRGGAGGDSGRSGERAGAPASGASCRRLRRPPAGHARARPSAEAAAARRTDCTATATDVTSTTTRVRRTAIVKREGVAKRGRGEGGWTAGCGPGSRLRFALPAKCHVTL